MNDFPLSDTELLAMPKVDLHVHLVGSAAPDTVAALAARHPDAGVPTSIDALESFFAFRDFEHFLQVYGAVSGLVRSGADVVMLVIGLGDDLAAQNVRYAEVTVTPSTHERAGIPPAELSAALTAGALLVREQHGVELAWVYDIVAGDGDAAAASTLAAALQHPPERLVGFGLGGAEASVRRQDFARYFADARAAGLHSVPHAGETTGPVEVWAAIRHLGAERVGHGIAAASDVPLMAHLREQRITLEVCVSSNIATGAVDSIEHHPMRTLLDAGVPVTLGSDDPPMFNTSLVDEYRRVRDAFRLGRADLLRLVRTGIDASFADDHLKAGWHRELDGFGTRRSHGDDSTPGTPGRP